MAALLARCVPLERPGQPCRQPGHLGASTFRRRHESRQVRRVASDEAATVVQQQGAASQRQPASQAVHDGSDGAGHASEPQQADREQLARAAGVPAAGASAPAAVSPAAQLGSAAGRSLEQEVAELRVLLLQQAEQQAEAARVIQQQQQTITTLERRLLGGGAEASGAELVAASSAAAAARPGSAAPLDGPASVMEPSVMGRPVQGAYRQGMPNANWTSWGPRDHALLPRRIVLVRHAQSKGNVDPFQYTYVPDPSVPLTAKGWEQAVDAGEKVKALLEAESKGRSYRLFFYTSPYLRCKQTTEGMVQAFSPDQLLGVQEEVQLREQDFGNFQDAEGKKREKLERLRYGRFFYRFPHGESGADVYDRMTVFQDHLVRDMNAGRYGEGCTVVLCTHGLASRIFLQRWFHWTVDQFLAVWNPPNAEPIVLERIDLLADGASCPDPLQRRGGGGTGLGWVHTKALYRLRPDSRQHLTGMTDDMCSTTWVPRGVDNWRAPREPFVDESISLD